jgi:hypothetical protein
MPRIEITSLKRIPPFTLALALALGFMTIVAGLSFLTNATRTVAATAVPVQSCSFVTVNNIQTQSVALGQAEKITVNWSFNPPSGDSACIKVQNYEIWIEVTRRSGRKNTRKIDASATSTSVNAEFTEAGIGNLSDKIISVKAVVTANLLSAKGEKTLSGL